MTIDHTDNTLLSTNINNAEMRTTCFNRPRKNWLNIMVFSHIANDEHRLVSDDFWFWGSQSKQYRTVGSTQKDTLQFTSILLLSYSRLMNELQLRLCIKCTMIWYSASMFPRYKNLFQGYWYKKHNFYQNCSLLL